MVYKNIEFNKYIILINFGSYGFKYSKMVFLFTLTIIDF